MKQIATNRFTAIYIKMNETNLILTSNHLKRRLLSYAFFLICLLPLVSCQQQSLLGFRPLAENGVLDLRQWDFQKDGTIPLNGQWTFYWRELLEPIDFETGEPGGFIGMLTVPGRWDGYESKQGTLPGSGYATLRLHIRVGPTSQPFALKIPDMATSYKMWINNRVVSGNGVVGKSKETSTPQFLPKVISFPADSEDIYITLQVSNFRHKKGGVWLPIEFGSETEIRQKRIANVAFELFLVGSMLVMSFYHFGLFILRRSDRSTIYFSLVCLLVAIRTLVVGERFLIWLFPDFSWEIYQKMEYLSFYLGAPFFYLFISSLYTEFSKRVGTIMTVVSALFSVFTLVTPVILFSHGILYYQVIMLLLCLYIPYVLIKTIINKREGAILVSIGVIILTTTVLYEILAENEIVYNLSLSSIGIFIFIFVQSVMLSIRFSKAFTMSEILSEELENKVEERTRGLQKAHEEIVTANEKLKETQHQLVQSQKMEAMGTLAGGIAHEFNNILGTILGYSEMLSSEVQENGMVKEGLYAIIQSGNRAADLVRQILTFSRSDSMELSPMIIQSSIEDMLKVIRTTLPESMSMDINIQPDCQPIMANKTQVSQVLLNLCSNAVDAMREKGGVLNVELKEKSLHQKVLPEGFKVGLYLELRVSDSGIGMTDKVKDRIFDPFYTTKEVDEGTGLGLSIVHGIVQSHSGFIKVDTLPGKGTTFSVFFPITKAIPIDTLTSEEKPKKGKGHILIVEDEKDLLNLYRVMLQKQGYKSSIFNNGIEALENFKAHPDLYDLVFTDQMMPKLTGFDLSREILKIRPEIPIIIATGHSPTVSFEEAKKAGIKDFMTKPVRFSVLSNKIAELI